MKIRSDRNLILVNLQAVASSKKCTLMLQVVNFTSYHLIRRTLPAKQNGIMKGMGFCVISNHEKNASIMLKSISIN